MIYVIILKVSCDRGAWAGPPISFCPIHHGLVSSLPSHSHLCWNTLQGSQKHDAKAKILAATVKESWQGQEDSHALPDDLKKVACLCLFYTLNRQGPLPIENTDVDPQLQQAASLCQAIQPMASSSKVPQPHGGHKYHRYIV